MKPLIAFFLVLVLCAIPARTRAELQIGIYSGSLEGATLRRSAEGDQSSFGGVAKYVRVYRGEDRFTLYLVKSQQGTPSSGEEYIGKIQEVSKERLILRGRLKKNSALTLTAALDLQSGVLKLLTTGADWQLTATYNTEVETKSVAATGLFDSEFTGRINGRTGSLLFRIVMLIDKQGKITGSFAIALAGNTQDYLPISGAVQKDGAIKLILDPFVARPMILTGKVSLKDDSTLVGTAVNANGETVRFELSRQQRR